MWVSPYGGARPHFIIMEKEAKEIKKKAVAYAIENDTDEVYIIWTE